MDPATPPAAAAGTLKLGDLTVNRLGFGAMRVAGPDIWGEPKDRAAMRRLLVRAFELGHTFFDTADSYGPDVSEALIAEVVKDLRGRGILQPHSKEPDEHYSLNPARAADVFDQACTGGVGSACASLGTMLQHGDRIPRDSARAVSGMTLTAGLPISTVVTSRLVGWKLSEPSSKGGSKRASSRVINPRTGLSARCG